MLKAGQTAIVTQDCELKKGEVVELNTDFGSSWSVYHNGVRFHIEPRHLKPAKPKRWKPEVGEKYWSNGLGIPLRETWRDTGTDNSSYDYYDVHRTYEEAIAERDRTLADRKERYGE